MKTEIIRFYDNENYDYPLLEIQAGKFKQLKKDYEEYVKDNDEYNYDDFIYLISKKGYVIRTISWDNEMFF